MTMPLQPAPGARRALRGAWGTALLAALLGTAACEIPTGLPEWETTWVVPADSVRIEVARLLPSSVQVVAGPAFQLSLSPVTVSRTLGEVCGPNCTAANGQQVPKPQFTITLGERIGLPADVVSANLTGGVVAVVLQHTFGFDPLRPQGATTPGFLVVEARAGTQTLAKDSISSTARSFPPNTAFAVNLPLAAASITGPIDVTVRLFSPAGDPVTINTSQRITMTATPQAVRLSQAQVRVSNRAVSADAVELDFADVDQTVSERVRRGALRLRIVNPFTATGPFTLRVTTPTRTIQKSIQLAAGTTEIRVEFTEEEIRSILGASPVTLSLNGTVTGTGGVVTARPDQAVVVNSRLELVIVPLEGE